MKYIITAFFLCAAWNAGGQSSRAKEAGAAIRDAERKVAEAERRVVEAERAADRAREQALRAEDSAQRAEDERVEAADRRRYCDTCKHGRTISIGSGGFHYDSGRPDSIDHSFEVQYGMLDLGINSLIDHTQYPEGFAPGVVGYKLPGFLHVSPEQANKELFSLRQSKSINVNIYPIMFKARLYKSARQRVTLATGLGLQLYNFRFTKPVSYESSPETRVVLDTISFSKNKLAFNYLTVPLMLNGKTKLAPASHGSRTGSNFWSTHGPGYWLTYGVGISGGYLLSSWTKQISDERGKQKNHDPFNFRNTNVCVNAEIGLDGFVRLYATYQLTALHESGPLDQHPLCIGLRFFGI